MIKKITYYLLAFVMLFVLAYSISNYINNSLKIELRYPIFKVYFFHFIWSFIISSGFLMLSKVKKWDSQLGFVYIFTMVTKFLFFAVIFKKTVFNIDSLTKTESLNLLIPLFLFLFLEVYFITNTLKAK